MRNAQGSSTKLLLLLLLQEQRRLWWLQLQINCGHCSLEKAARIT